MSQVTIPKLHELQDLVATTITAASLFTAAGITAISDKGTTANKLAEDTALRTKGFSVSVYPLQSGKTRDQSGSGWIIDAKMAIRVNVNSDVNASATGANIDIYQAVVAIINALTRKTRHPGGEFFKLDEEAFDIGDYDDGIWGYVLFFRKEVLL